MKAQAPVADFKADVLSGCSPLTVTLTDQSTNAKSWNWDITGPGGTGTLRSGQGPQVISLSTPGTYTVVLTVQNANGINSVTKTDYITVNPSPSVGISANKTLTCLPADIQFMDMSVANAGTIVSWHWDFGDNQGPGSISILKNPTHNYTSPGFYNIYLAVVSSAGCTNAADYARYIRVVDGVKANFSYTGPSTCDPPFNVLYNNLTSGPGNLSYAWDLGNATTSTQTSPTGTYGTAGNYTITLIANSDFGCADTIQKTIPITGSTTSFLVNGNRDTVCLGSSITFQSTSSPVPAKVSWDFGDGTKYNGLTPPAKTYTSPGIYTVVMNADFGNCSNTATKTITVSALPTVDFSSANSNSFCKPAAPVVFQDLSPDVATVLWDFGDGSTSNSTTTPLTHIYNSTGNFTATLTITDSKGCTNKITKTNFSNVLTPYVHAGGIPSGLCKGQSFSPYFDGGTVDGVASYTWDFGDGSPTSNSATPSHSYTTNGNYTVKLTITSNGGCTNSFSSSPIQVGDDPVVNFIKNIVSACRSSAVTFTNTSAPAGQSWLWNFGDSTTSALQNPSHKFPDTGLYSIKLKVTNNGCSDSLTKTNFVNVQPPVAKFNYKIMDCAARNVATFLDSSATNPADGPISYLWNFGDPVPTTSTTVPPAPITFTYPATGMYNATLIVTNGACMDTMVKKVQIVNEKANFTLDRTPAIYCRNDNVTFTSTNTPANIKNYAWISDGGSQVNNPLNLVLSYGQTGPHTMQLIITDVNGCMDSSALKSFTTTGPTALFTIANKGGGCNNSTITFNDSSVSSGGTITKWVYDFGDGVIKTFTAPPFTHIYTVPGTYPVKLTVYDNGGNNCSDIYTLNAIITKPVTKFSAPSTTFCPGTPLQFTDSSTGTLLTYNWSFGDGTTDTAQSPVHTYPNKDSVYTVKLVITDSIGCADSLSVSNYIKIRAPKATYTVKDTASLCPPLETKFNFTGTDYQSFYWDFGDGPISSLANTSHFYNVYGKYTAKLYVTGFGGCMDSASININVTDPYANTTYTFSPVTACNELTSIFSVTPPYSTKFIFYFGDNAADSSQMNSFQHTYTLPNIYYPYIFLEDSTGCQVIIGGRGQIYVQGAIPLFGVDKHAFCDSGSVYFSDYSQQGADPIVTRTWDFGDGSAPQPFTQDAIYDYTKPGLYVPKLTITTAANCTQTFTDTIRVLATPQPVITSAAAVCYNSPISFTGSLLVPPDTAITWAWNLGNGQTSDSANFAVVYGDTGVFHITLQASNSLGCKGDTSSDIRIYPLPTIQVTGDPSIVAGGAGIPIPVAYSANAEMFNWTPATGLSCTDCANPIATPQFTTTYKVVVTDANGCVSTKNITLLVTCSNKNFFIPNTFSPNNDGSNDVFYPRGTGLNLIQALRIFNRWGEEVFEKRNFPANDASSGWDGTYKGKKAPTDTYIYMIDIICNNANIITYKGNITLIR